MLAILTKKYVYGKEIDLCLSQQWSHVAETPEQLVCGGAGWNCWGVLGCPRCVLCVKMKRIVRDNCWLKRGDDLFLEKFVPVDGGEEGMVLDVVDSVRARPESVGGIPLEQSSEQGLGLWTQIVRHRELSLQNLIHRLLPVLSLERKTTRQHLIHKDSVAPPVCGEVMTPPIHNFRRHILHRPAKTERLLLKTLLAESKVCDGDVTIRVQQDILRL